MPEPSIIPQDLQKSFFSLTHSLTPGKKQRQVGDEKKIEEEKKSGKS